MVQFALPFDMDPAFPLKARAHFASDSATAADTFTWKFFINNAKQAGAVALPITAFGTQPTAAALSATGGVSLIHNKSNWGEVAANTWTRAEVEAGHMIGLICEIDASDSDLAGGEECYLLGIEISYVRQETRGGGSRADHDSYT